DLSQFTAKVTSIKLFDAPKKVTKTFE
ncbi:uncharacterized protein METZ01_LOCUS466127, partial [marine metagenome]